MWMLSTATFGMQGTAITEAEEFFHVYKLNVIQVPSRLPNRRRDYPTRLFVSRIEKLLSVYKYVMASCHQQRPVLIGTSSVSESEAILSLLLNVDQTVAPENLALLNAKPENVRREAQIIAQAGLPGAVTIATNMAGRGTDIVLGGNPKGLALQILMKLFACYFLTGLLSTHRL